MSADNVPDLLVGIEIEDFFFETTPGMWKLSERTYSAASSPMFSLEWMYTVVSFRRPLPSE